MLWNYNVSKRENTSLPKSSDDAEITHFNIDCDVPAINEEIKRFLDDITQKFNRIYTIPLDLTFTNLTKEDFLEFISKSKRFKEFMESKTMFLILPNNIPSMNNSVWDIQPDKIIGRVLEVVNIEDQISLRIELFDTYFKDTFKKLYLHHKCRAGIRGMMDPFEVDKKLIGIQCFYLKGIENL